MTDNEAAAREIEEYRSMAQEALGKLAELEAERGEAIQKMIEASISRDEWKQAAEHYRLTEDENGFHNCPQCSCGSPYTKD